MATTVQPSSRERFGQWWQLRSRGEGMLIALAAIVTLAGVAWIALWQPLQRDVLRLTRDLGSQRATLAEARRRAEDIAVLSRKTAVPASQNVRADFYAAMARHGVKPAAVDRIENDRLRVTVDAIAFDALPPLLETLQRDARLRAVDLVATARVEPGQVRVELTLAP
jgi:type II secretory pathway component PulM